MTDKFSRPCPIRIHQADHLFDGHCTPTARRLISFQSLGRLRLSVRITCVLFLLGQREHSLNRNALGLNRASETEWIWTNFGYFFLNRSNIWRELVMQTRLVDRFFNVLVQKQIPKSHLFWKIPIPNAFESKWKSGGKHTLATPVIIRLPPLAPNTSLISSFSSTTIIGDIDDMGRLPGLI